MAFIGERAIGATESWDGVTYRRSLDLPGGPGVVGLVAHDDHVAARLALTSWGDLAAAVQRIRRLLDLDADPTAVDEALGRDPVMRTLVTAVPGRRSPASVDAFETAVRAVIGQQVSVAGARTVAGRIVEAVGTPIDAVDVSFDEVTRLFPRPEQLLAAPDEAFSMPQARRDTIRRLAAAVLAGDVELHVGADPAVAREQLLRLRGVGPWTADYVVMPRPRPPGHVPRRRSRRPPCARRARRRGRAGPRLGTVALVRSAPPLGESVARRSSWKDHSMNPDHHLLDHQLLAKRSRTRLHGHGHAGRPDHHRCVSRGVRAILWPDD